MTSLASRLLLGALCGAVAMLTPGLAGEMVSGVDRSGMNPTIRPQDDLDGYANGAWNETTPIPADKSRWGAFDLLTEASNTRQREIIEELAGRTDLAPGSSERKVADLFASLMDEAQAEALGLQPIQEQFALIDAIASLEDLAKAFGTLQRQGITVPLETAIGPDSHNSERYAVYILQSGLGLPNRSYYLDQSPKLEEVRTQYPRYIARLLTLGGRARDAAAADRIMALETSIARAQWTPEDSRDATKTDNRFAIAELAGVSEHLPWAAYLESCGLRSAEGLYLRQPSYASGLGDLLVQTPLADWKSYLCFHVLNEAAPWLTAAIAGAEFDFYGRLISGTEEQEPRWQRAVRAVNGALGEAVGQAYVARHFPPEAKQRMVALVDNILAAFQDSLAELSWMSPETRARAEEKRGRMTVKIGYPDRWKDYGTLAIRRNDAVGNLRAAQAWEYQRDVDRINDPVDRSEWHMTPQTVNAYFNPRQNEIVFPAGILQPPFFNLAADDAVNYGGIGAVIGHEIGHAFDDQGRKYDGAGNLRDWWSAADAAAFSELTQRLVEQFNAFEALPGMHVNGRLTLGENIGDLTGITIAHRAYLHSLGGREAPVIDGFTGVQRFFLGYAQIWRTKMRPEAMRRQVLTNPHAPGQFRVLGPVRNFDPFYEAFDVREGDAMYLAPEQRVAIW